ncbi:PAS domain-containing hybrid sensor histidine kinase/response regulator [Uliginosibacterium gangwonense]|uniref:PAS domain-containing hybrid sensor histidine kinase/response regulator n=1 Tax=Uliginosibacterium gangwonense TaxID=392736 RepID=UPI0003785A8C|nr:ATP-binding protein [Uliginosibacterium gangwonense]
MNRDTLFILLAALLAPLAGWLGFIAGLPVPVCLMLVAVCCVVLPARRTHALHKRAQNHATRTHAFIQRLIDGIPDPVYIKGADSCYMMVNDAFAREHRFSKAAIIGMSYIDLTADVPTGTVSAQEDRDVIAGNDLEKEQHTTLPSTGEECFRIVTKRRSVWMDGSPVVVGAHFYITRWKIAERELQQALQREVERRERTQSFIQRLIDVIPQPVYVRDAQSRFLMVNEAFLQERQIAATDLIGNTPVMIAPSPEIASLVLEEDRDVLAGKVILKEERTTHPVSGEERFRLISKGSCLDAEGNKVIVGANFNITSWRRAEREARLALQAQSRLRDFLQRIFDALPTPLFVEDLSTRKLLMANSALATLAGAPHTSLLGKRMDELPRHDLAQGLQTRNPIDLPEGQVRECEMTLSTGTPQPRSFIMREVVSSGLEQQPVRIGVLTDITSLREAELRWQQASTAKSLFLASMSHEIRTPLNGVLGTLRLALNETSLNGEARTYVETSLSSAELLLAIISDILDFSKIEAGELKLERIDFSLRRLLEDTLPMFRDHASQKGLRFEVSIAEDLPPYQVGDPIRIRQVLTNLVSNAIKFTPTGHIHVELKYLSDGNTQLRVQDTGIGIAAEAIPRLFQKFQQADSSTTRRFGGTGLGLAICRELVEAMGGSIAVRSEESQGACFEVLLPLKLGNKPPEEKPNVLPPHSHCLRVLCAEDVTVNQMIVRAQLRNMGHEVKIVDNGLAALEALATADYDLVLMDGHMPKMDGREATQCIRAGGNETWQVRNPNIRIVALTADASTDNKEYYLDAGMDEFLTKPVQENQLHAALTRTIEVLLAQGIALQPNPNCSHANAHCVPITAAKATAAMVLAPKLNVDDPELAAEMTPMMVETFRSALASIDEALKTQDFHTLSEELHSIKGSTGYFADQKLHHMAQTLEAAARHHQTLPMEEQWPTLRAGLEAFITMHT